MKKQSRQLGSEKVSTLLMNLSIPAMVGMLVMAAYNLADAIFIGRGIGTLGLAAVSIAFPVQMIIMAIAGAFGMGGASVISRRLGEGKKEEADHTMGNVITMVFLTSLLLAVCGLLFVNPILIFFGSTNTILPFAEDYLSIILIGSIFIGFAMSTNNIARAEGNARIAMLTMIVSAVVNVILDPIFIFALKMGMQGAALATIIAQASAAVFMAYYFFSGRSSLSIGLHHLIPNLSILKETLTIGSAAFVRQTAGSLTFMVVNHMLGNYGGDVAVAIYGVVNRLAMIMLMPMMGIVQGMQPIVGFNYGAGSMTRVNETVKLALKYSTYISAGAFLIMMIFPAYLIRVFSTDTELIIGGTAAMRIMFAAAFLIGAQMIAGGFYQALGKARQALILSMARQILFLIPLVLILPILWTLNGVWLAFPLADFLAFMITACIFIGDKKKGLFSLEESREKANC